MTKSTKNTVKLTLDPRDLPPLSYEQKARLTALATMPDEQVDTSDAPYHPDVVWVKAVGQLPTGGSLSEINEEENPVDQVTDTKMTQIAALVEGVEPEPDFAEECRRQSQIASQADLADKDMEDFMDAALADIKGWTSG